MNKIIQDKIYKLVSQRDDSINAIFQNIKNNINVRETIELLTLLELDINKNNILAAANRFAGLNDEGLINIFKSLKYSPELIDEKLEIAYKYTIVFHKIMNDELLENILSIEELEEDYKLFIQTIYQVTNIMNDVHLKWIKQILHFNQTLIDKYGSLEKAVSFIKNINGFDTINEQIPSCCYSGLVQDENQQYHSKTYMQLFPQDMLYISNIISNFYMKTQNSTDKTIQSYREYMVALVSAFSSIDNIEVINKWKQVNENWMNITSPLQPVHPTEYYDDNIRHAVSLEFDLRITDPNSNIGNSTGFKTLKMMSKVLQNSQVISDSEKDTLSNIIHNNIQKIQLHIGKLIFYSGNEMNGLMSAQVLPNYPDISEKSGKKIFAFLDKGFENNKSKSKMKIDYEIFNEYFLNKRNQLLEDKNRWSIIYDISTIGHEYGHILWMNNSTEKNMSKTSVFKNIEEFKASASGIMSFFDSDREEEYWEDLFINVITRSIKLISWKESNDLVPYYCEALITLDILFNSKTIEFKNNKVKVNIDKITYLKFKDIYTDSYLDLVDLYLLQKDAKEFLDKYTILDKNNFYIPKNNNVRFFTSYYFDLYRNIGNDI